MKKYTQRELKTLQHWEQLRTSQEATMKQEKRLNLQKVIIHKLAIAPAFMAVMVCYYKDTKPANYTP